MKDLLERAREKGNLDKVLGSVKEINSRLRRDPLVFGEPLFHLKHQKGQVRTAIVSPLSVSYAVHEDRQTVIVARPLQLLVEPGL